MTLKEIETNLINEGKNGYAVIRIDEYIADRTLQIGYFKDCAKSYGISYENTDVDLIKYVGWNI
jgi:hypothetical protein